MAGQSNILAWKILWTEEPDKPQFMGSQRVGRDWATDHERTRSCNTLCYSKVTEVLCRGIKLRLRVGRNWVRVWRAGVLMKEIPRWWRGERDTCACKSTEFCDYFWVDCHHNPPNMPSVFWEERLKATGNYLKCNRSILFKAIHMQITKGGNLVFHQKGISRCQMQQHLWAPPPPPRF